MAKCGKILVIRGGAMGDFILTLPVLSALRATFPETGLELLGYSHIAQLACAGGLVDAVRSIESRPLAGFFAANAPLAAELGEYFAQFNIIISYLYDPDKIFQGNVMRCSHAQFIAGPHRPDEAEGIHATEVFLRPLQRLAIFGADPVPRLRLSSSALGVAGEPWRGDARLALHPGSGSERKNWPEPLWAGLMTKLIVQTNWHFLLVGGEAEGERLDHLAKILTPERSQVARNLPLTDLARKLAGCRAFVGHDSGISHLAAALGLPGIVLWGPSNEAVWRPQGERVRILHGLNDLPVERVLQEINRIS
jgi:heptosyltransferase-2